MIKWCSNDNKAKTRTGRAQPADPTRTAERPRYWQTLENIAVIVVDVHEAKWVDGYISKHVAKKIMQFR